MMTFFIFSKNNYSIETWNYKSKLDLGAEAARASRGWNFLRIFIHELALSADAKTETPLLEEFVKRYRGQNSALAYKILNDQLVKLTFSTLRAYQVEDQILKELGYKLTQNKYRNKGTCGQLFKENFLIVKQFDPIFPMTKESVSLNFKKINLESISKILENEKILNDENQLISLCENELKYRFTSPSLKKVFSRGPRPRIGDGSGG